MWLPNTADPVVCGRLSKRGDQYLFNYVESYLGRPDAISLYEPELPLQPGQLPLLPELNRPGCIFDAAPNTWGRNVVERRLVGPAQKRVWSKGNEIDELCYLLESSSDRFGAIDFQSSPDRYEPRTYEEAPLDALYDVDRLIEQGQSIPTALDYALCRDSEVGGGHPKALLHSADKKYVAKFPSSDLLPEGRQIVIKAEFVAMRLAAACGLNVAPVSLARACGKDVLLVERFDRKRGKDGTWCRLAAVSALTLLGLRPTLPRGCASYQQLAEVIRHRFHECGASLKELFGRVSFNILCSSLDDHPGNHAALWDGSRLSLTPAFDISPVFCPAEPREQAMHIKGSQRSSRLELLLDTATDYRLSEVQALTLVRDQIAAIGEHWDAVCKEAELTPANREYLGLQAFLPPYAFEELATPRATALNPVAAKIRRKLAG